MLRGDLIATFRRCLRDSNGRITDTLVFQPGAPVAIGAKELAAVVDDLGDALVCAQERKKDKKIVFVPDWDATADLALDRANTLVAEADKSKRAAALSVYQRKVLSDPAPAPKKKAAKAKSEGAQAAE